MNKFPLHGGSVLSSVVKTCPYVTMLQFSGGVYVFRPGFSRPNAMSVERLIYVLRRRFNPNRGTRPKIRTATNTRAVCALNWRFLHLLNTFKPPFGFSKPILAFEKPIFAFEKPISFLETNLCFSGPSLCYNYTESTKF